MKKIIFLFILNLSFCNIVFAESYYFNECLINEKITANYLIDFDKNVINVTLATKDGLVQKLEDKIQIVTEDKVTSKIISSGKSDVDYFQYYLNAKSKSVTKQMYKKEGGFFKLSGSIRQSFCVDVKADWDKEKIEEAEISKEQKQMLKTQEKILKKQDSLPECQESNYEEWTNCLGMYVAGDGSKYTGLFKDGKIIEGTALYPGGAEYIGNFKFDKPNGQGTFTFSDGSKHFGEWKDGKGHGQGIKMWEDGREYAGEFINDKPHGQGTFTYPDGSKYIGEYKDGNRHGQGTLKYPDGSSYVGQFVAGIEHGKGLCIKVDGTSVDCQILKMEKGDPSAGKNRRNILIEAKKWVKITEYESTAGKGKIIMDQLKNDFNTKAIELCSPAGNFDVLKKSINIAELDETPAFGLVAKVKLAIDGVVECK